MWFRVVLLKFTSVSRKPTASTFRIKEYSEAGGSMFFETYASLHEATLHRFTDDSNLQEISHFGKTCVRNTSSISTCTLQIAKHHSMIHLALPTQKVWTIPLACTNYLFTNTVTYNLTVSLDIKSLFSCSALVKLMTHIKIGQFKREITEFSNIYMTLKSMSE